MNIPPPQAGTLMHLVDRRPEMSGEDLAANLTPPPQFATASFDSYRPDDAYPSQTAAVDYLRMFSAGPAPVKTKWFARKPKTDAVKPGVYLDGGFGVGKTHLLAALWHAEGGSRKYFGTFIEYTALVGALGFNGTVKLLTGSTLICIDEFELDDPGDTMMMTRLLTELAAQGTRIAATSNTPPNALGEGRFAAQDFLREIHSLASTFETLRIDGTDYRRRTIEGHCRTASDTEITRAMESAAASGTRMSVDDFTELVEHLAAVHPSRFIRLLDDVEAIAITDTVTLESQAAALRLVAFIDRVYDAQIPIIASGIPLDTVFTEEMLTGGFRKKYLRAMSRMISLTSEL
ncbi:cell division protein ZapE [Microbacterium sp. MPKO10]|uniref:cell division protein ZapE n=1 Tax=Microbacterium sp. MPKO10 TaxID=2989818 RepID=UPI002235DD2A|nr:cell division protein ZapE [Microbacterium sp. MPKO10]MCW4459580.1 cell division protein ZapE [Microbacterium sp. MPKO10]